MIDKEKLKNFIEESTVNDDSLKELIFDIVAKIDNLESNKEINIATLINYNPSRNFVEPLTQGKIYHSVFEICGKINISLKSIESGVGGLAFYYNFKKLK